MYTFRPNLRRRANHAVAGMLSGPFGISETRRVPRPCAQRVGDLRRPQLHRGRPRSRLPRSRRRCWQHNWWTSVVERGVVVELVPVVDDDCPGGEVVEHRRLERGQIPVAEQEVGVEPGAGDQQVLVGLLRPGRGGVGPTRSGVSSMHSTAYAMRDQRADPWCRPPVEATLRRGRAGRARTRARAWRRSTPRRNCTHAVGRHDDVHDHQVDRRRPAASGRIPTCPYGRAPSGRAAVLDSAPHRTACWSYWVTIARICGISVCWKRSTTPRSAAPARSCPHAHALRETLSETVGM